MKYLNKTIEYGLYLLVFLLPLQTRWIIKAGLINNGLWEYGTYSLYGTDVLLVIVLLLFIFSKIAFARWRTRHDQLDPSNILYRGNEILDCSSVLTSVLKKKTGCLRGNDKRERGNDKNGQARNDSLELSWGSPYQSNKMLRWFIGGLVLTSAISIFFASDKPLALYKFGWLALGIGLSWLIASANYDRIKLIYIMLAGLFLQAGLGIWQFLNQATFANKWLGLALHRGVDLGASVIETVGTDGIGERWLRAYGSFDHPNILGGAVAVGIIFLVGEKLRKSYSDKIISSKTLYFFWASLIVFTAALFFSFSRSAWLALAVGLIAMIISAALARNLKRQKGLAETILAMGILLFILFSQYQNLITVRLGGEGRLETKSNSERLVSYQEAGQLIKNNWLFGAGLGNYTLALRDEIISDQTSYYYQPTHNVFLLAFSEIGIFGLLFFIGVIASVFMRLLRLPAGPLRLSFSPPCRSASEAGEASRQVASPASWQYKASRNDRAITILVALVIVMLLDHWLWSLHFGVLFFWLVLGLAGRATHKT